MKKIKLAWKILRKMSVDKIIIIYLILMLISSFLLTKFEPQIDNVFEGVWYCFITFTTIGFGDIVATTLIGRIITIIIALYGMFIVSLITGVLINYYQEINKIKVKESVEQFMDKLEKLPELSKEELKLISEKVKNKKYKL